MCGKGDVAFEGCFLDKSIDYWSLRQVGKVLHMLLSVRRFGQVK